MASLIFALREAYKSSGELHITTTTTKSNVIMGRVAHTELIQNTQLKLTQLALQFARTVTLQYT